MRHSTSHQAQPHGRCSHLPVRSTAGQQMARRRMRIELNAADGTVSVPLDGSDVRLLHQPLVRQLGRIPNVNRAVQHSSSNQTHGKAALVTRHGRPRKGGEPGRGLHGPEALNAAYFTPSSAVQAKVKHLQIAPIIIKASRTGVWKAASIEAAATMPRSPTVLVVACSRAPEDLL